MTNNFRQFAGMIVGTVIGVTMGHMLIRKVLRRDPPIQQAPPNYYQQPYSSPNQYQDNRPREPLDSLKNQKFT